MGMRLQRLLGSVAALEPGQFTVRTPDGWPVLRCPRCGCVDELPRTHSVDRTGRVTPVWSCPTVTCSMREWLELGSILEETG